MATKHNGKHFKVECKIDGKWFGSDYVFPDSESARAFKDCEESRGSGNVCRVVSTSDPVNLPPAEGEDESESEGEDEDENHLSLSLDWATLHELSILCPTTFCRPNDGDLERVYSQCREGCPLQGRVFS